VVVFSDLLGVVDQAGGLEALIARLSVLRARGADVALVHVLDPDELDLPFPGVVRFFDMERDREIQVDASSIRDTYREEVGAYLDAVQRQSRAAGITYQLARTDAAPAQALVQFVAERLGPRWR